MFGAVLLALATGCEKDAPDPRPIAGNPSQAKGSIDFAAVEAAIAAVPPEALTTTQALADYMAAHSRSGTERAYAVYRWVRNNLQTDLAQLTAPYVDPGTQDAEVVFRTRRAVCAGYAQLFARLAQLSGVHAVTVMGYAVIRNYDPNVPPSAYEHMWNAVEIGGQWFLVDSSWATSPALDGTRDPNFFFFTDPAAFVRRHWPFDAAWQLIEPPISEDTFWSRQEQKAP